MNAISCALAPGALTGGAAPVADLGGLLFPRLDLPLKRQNLRFGDGLGALVERRVLTHDRGRQVAKFLVQSLEVIVYIQIGHGQFIKA